MHIFLTYFSYEQRLLTTSLCIDVNSLFIRILVIKLSFMKLPIVTKEGDFISSNSQKLYTRLEISIMLKLEFDIV